MRKEQSKVISILVPMETKDSLRRGATMVITKNLTWHTQSKTHALGIINSPEFFIQRISKRKGLFIFFLEQGVVGGYHMKCLGTSILYSL